MADVRLYRKELQNDTEDLKKQINNLVKSYVSKQIDKEAYGNLLIEYRTILAEKERLYTNIGFDDIEITKIFENSISLLSSISYIYEKTTIENKQRIVIALFGKDFILTKEGYRTPSIHPFFTDKLFVFNNLNIIKNNDLNDKNSENLSRSAKEKIIELFKVLKEAA